MPGRTPSPRARSSRRRCGSSSRTASRGCPCAASPRSSAGRTWRCTTGSLTRPPCSTSSPPPPCGTSPYRRTTVWDWAARLRELIGSIDEQLRANPGLGGILLDRMLSTDRRILNAAMDILVDAGFDDADVLMAYATVHTYLFGRYQLVTAPPPAVRAGGGGHGGQARHPAPEAEWARLLRVRRGHPDRRTARSPRGHLRGGEDGRQRLLSAGMGETSKSSSNVPRSTRCLISGETCVKRPWRVSWVWP